MGKDLMSGNYGARYLTYSLELIENVIYIGELSTDTNERHGRDIHIYSDWIFIGYMNNGVCTGKYIYIDNEGVFVVGEFTVDSDGRRHKKGMLYNKDGTSEQFDR